MLAYWHIPIYSSSPDHQPDMQSIYPLLYPKGADVVLTGHAHFYERFAPQDGRATPSRTGSRSSSWVGRKQLLLDAGDAGREQRGEIANTFGVLQMTPRADRATAGGLVPSTSGGSTDAGTASCH